MEVDGHGREHMIMVQALLLRFVRGSDFIGEDGLPSFAAIFEESEDLYLWRNLHKDEVLVEAKVHICK